MKKWQLQEAIVNLGELASRSDDVTNFLSIDYIRPPSKLAYAEEFEGDAERRTAAYSNVREDSSTAPTYKLPAEVEFRRRSIDEEELFERVQGKARDIEL